MGKVDTSNWTHIGTTANAEFYAAELEDYAFDIPLANRLLDEAGYLGRDGEDSARAERADRPARRDAGIYHAVH